VGNGDVESVHGSTAIQQDHVQPVGERREKQSQCVILQLSSKITYSLWVDDERDRVSSKITYFLWVSDGRDSVSGWFCAYPVRSHTFCGRAMGETVSVSGSAPIEQDHVQPVGGRWERQHQCVALHLSSKITYFTVMHIHLTSARLWLGWREVHTNRHINTVLLVWLFVHLSKINMLVLVLVHWLMGLIHHRIIGSPHLERHRRMFWLGCMHGKGCL
jgi:hypothetical protein